MLKTAWSRAAATALWILVLCAAVEADPVPVPLDITSAFNVDAWCGPKEYQECEAQDQDLIELFGGLTDGNGPYVVSQGSFLAADTAGEGMTYSSEDDWYHPQYLSGTQGTPADGVLLGGDLRIYHIASAGGNGTMQGDWTEVADPATHAVKFNCAVVGSDHSIATWQIAELVIELPAAQQVKYTDVNFVLAAMNRSDRARNMEIYALYTDDTSALLYAFSTDEGGSGPYMTENNGGDDFAIVYTMTRLYGSSSGTTGAIVTSSASFYEFASPIALDSTRDLRGFRVRDSNPTLNWNSRGVTLFAATARPLVDTGVNTLPVADAGDDQLLVDSDWTGEETVTLDGSGSYDQDGAIVAYLWQEGGETIATGAVADVSLAVGLHTITLLVTDNAGGTAEDTVEINVSEAASGTYYVDQAVGSDTNPGTEALPFATIGHATALVWPGDTIVVRAGIYRESPSLANNGEADNPITLRAAAGERVVVSGADRLTGWQVCTEEIAKGNANFANMYYVDLTYEPTRLVQDEYDLQKARLPNDGWFICQGGDTTTLVDAVNLTGEDDYWVGAEIFVWDTSITAQYLRNIVDYDAATHTITVNSVWNSAVVLESGSDRYYLMNKVELIDGEGDWAVEDLGDGTYRVFLWTDGGGSPDDHVIEASRPGSFVVNLGARSYWVIDGLEVRHGQGHGIGTWASSCLGHNVIQNCCIHHNDGTGIYGRYNDYSTYRRNYVVLNGGGISTVGSAYVLIEENEVGWNLYDGVLPTGPDGDEWAEGVVLRGNYIHDHYKWGHPDNAQSYNNVRGLTVENNLFLHAVQSFMMEETEDTLYRNNVILGAAAYSIILGHGNTENTIFEHNTLMYSGYGLVAHSGWGYHYSDNLVVPGHTTTVWGGVGDGTYSTDCTDYTSDYNVFWHGPDLTGPVVVWNRNWGLTFANYVAQSGQDTHSYYQDPLLANMPSYFSMLDSGKQHLFTATRVYVPSSYIGLFAVGDHVEINWDGTLRTVTAVNTGSYYVEFTPGDEAFALKADQIANWKTKTDYEFDLTPLAGSPLIGNASDGGNIGSDIDVVARMAGDFDGDGLRDIPVWPYEAVTLPTLEIAAALDYGWVYQNTASATADRHKSVLTVGITSGGADGQTYAVTLDQDGHEATDFQMPSGSLTVALGAPLTVEILGGRTEASTAGQTYQINVTVTGSPGLQTATAGVSLELRTLGDVNGSGSVTAEDKLEINKKLNGLDTLTGIGFRELDLTGDGSAINAEDKLIVNLILNGATVP